MIKIVSVCQYVFEGFEFAARFCPSEAQSVNNWQEFIFDLQKQSTAENRSSSMLRTRTNFLFVYT